MNVSFGTVNEYVLFGGGELLLKCAQILKRKNMKVTVITSPRHAEEKFGRTGASLDSMQVDYQICEKVRDFRIGDFEGKMGISIGAAWIFRKEFLDKWGGRFINLHGTRLPLNRGGGGFSWLILQGDSHGCSLAHLVDPGIDTGDIIKQQAYVFPGNCRTPRDYEKHAMLKYEAFLQELFRGILSKRSFNRMPQNESASTYWPRLNTDIHGWIDWSWTATQIEKFICAFGDPYEGASTYVNGRQIRLKACYTNFWGSFHPFQYGLVYRIGDRGIFVAANKATILVTETSGDSSVEISVGDRFYTPQFRLDEAFSTHVKYTPEGLKT